MERSDIVTLDADLKHRYDDHWPGLSPGMAEHWLEVLAPYDIEVCLHAVREWAMDHTVRIPTLRDLLGLCLDLDHEARMQKARESVVERGGSALDALGFDVLKTAAELSADRAWAQGHVRIFLAMQGKPEAERHAQAAAMCAALALEDSVNAVAWRQEAAWWSGGAQGRPGTIMYEA